MGPAKQQEDGDRAGVAAHSGLYFWSAPGSAGLGLSTCHSIL
jgi:hypothetical protein